MSKLGTANIVGIRDGFLQKLEVDDLLWLSSRTSVTHCYKLWDDYILVSPNYTLVLAATDSWLYSPVPNVVSITCDGYVQLTNEFSRAH